MERGWRAQNSPYDCFYPEYKIFFWSVLHVFLISLFEVLKQEKPKSHTPPSPHLQEFRVLSNVSQALSYTMHLSAAISLAVELRASWLMFLGGLAPASILHSFYHFRLFYKTLLGCKRETDFGK